MIERQILGDFRQLRERQVGKVLRGRIVNQVDLHEALDHRAASQHLKIRHVIPHVNVRAYFLHGFPVRRISRNFARAKRCLGFRRNELLARRVFNIRYHKMHDKN